MSIYRSITGDTVDLIAFNQLGSEAHVVDIYEANRGLARIGPVLPMGTVVQIPEVSASTAPPQIRLWGDA